MGRKNRSLNTLLAGVAAAGLCGAVNLLVFSQVQHAPPGTRQLLRYDLTRTRAHSLSPQTRAVLAAQSEPLEIITLLRDVDATREPEGARIRQTVRDLADTTAEHAQNLRTRHVFLPRHVQTFEQVREQVANTLAPRVTPMRDALQRAQADAERLAEACQQAAELLTTLDQEGQFAQSTVATRVRQLRAEAQRTTLDLQQLAAGLHSGLQEPMPALAAHHTDARGVLHQAQRSTAVLHSTLQRMPASWFKDSRTRELQLQMVRVIEPLSAQVTRALSPLRQVRTPPAWTQAREALMNEECVVLLSGQADQQRARVVPLSALHRQSGAWGQAMGIAETAEEFVGEERLTGAIASLQWQVAPRVTLLHMPGMPALSKSASSDEQGEQAKAQNGLFDTLATRLRALGFEVDQLTLQGDWREAMAAKPTDQPRLWLACPTPMPRQLEDHLPVRSAMAELLRARLALGESALLMTGFNRFADPDWYQQTGQEPYGDAWRKHFPLLALAEDHQLRVQSWLQVLHPEAPQPGVDPVPSESGTFAVQAEKTAHPLTRALQGLRLNHQTVSPLLPGEGATALLHLPWSPCWTVNHQQITQADLAERENSRIAQPVVAALGAPQDKAGQLLVISDPLLLSDRIAGFGHHPERDPSGGADRAELPGYTTTFPANAELAVSACALLTDQTNLIAPGARSREVPRIAPDQAGLAALLTRLLTWGLPGLAVLLGGGIWVIRRK